MAIKTGSSSSLLLTASVVGAFGLGCLLRQVLAMQKKRTSLEGNEEQKLEASTTKPKPPMAPVGMMETIREVAGNQAPFFLLRLARELGPSVPIFGIPIPLMGGMYVVASGELQRQIMNDKRSDKPKKLYGKFEIPGNPAGIFTRSSNDSIWRSCRKGAAPAFSKSEVDRINAVCNQHVEEWIQERLEPLVAKNQSFDPSREMTYLTFCTIMEAGFECEPSLEEFERYTGNLNNFLREFGFRQIGNPFRRPFGWFLKDYRTAMRSTEENVAYLIEKVITPYRQNPNPSPRNTLIKLILNNPDIINDRHAVSEIGTFIAGGFDTIGFTLSTTLVLLAKHPEVAAKVQEEQAKVGPNQVSEYHSCVIKESRRFLTTAAMGSSRQFAESVEIGPYKIPAGAILLMPQMLPHRDEQAFQPDPDVFRPERWMGEPTEAMKESLLSFATGMRNCIGQALAMAELESVLPRLLSTYKFTVEEEGKLDFFLTLKFSGTRLRAERLSSMNHAI